MKPMKISVILCMSVALLSFVSTLNATPIMGTLNDPEVFKFEDNEFKIEGALVSRDGYLPETFKIEVGYNAKKSKSTNEFFANDADSAIVGHFKYFEILESNSVNIYSDESLRAPDPAEDGSPYSFYGILTDFEVKGIADLPEILYVYGKFTHIDKETYKDFIGYISKEERKLPDDSSAPVPEPATMLLMGAGMLGMAAMRRRIKK